MSPRVSDALLDPRRRAESVRVLARVVDEEVHSKRGVSGAAVRAAYAAVRRLDRGVVPRAVDEMLPDFARVLDWHWPASGVDPVDHLVDHAAEVTEDLLAVTDAQARHGHHAALAVVYHTLRSRAAGHVAAALPRLGRAVSDLVATGDPPPPSAARD